MSYLRMTHVSKGYSKGNRQLNVLKDVNLEVEEGSCTAIVGYSGAGKTTLISLLAGLQMPDSGTVEMDGKPILSAGPERGLVFQNYSLLPWLSAWDNVALA